MPRTAIRFACYGVMCLMMNGNPSLGDEQTTPAASRVATPGILIIAHRGDSKVAPENTLPAFASAVKAGADMVELDYYNSADGVPVVCHDEELDRTTDATKLWGGTKLKLTDKTLAELKLLDAGSWYAKRFAGTRLPTLAEALDTIQTGSMTLIERKGGDPATCIELLKQKNLLERVVVQSFDWDYLAGCHRIAPNLVLGALGEKQLTTEKLDEIANCGARAVGWEAKNLDAAAIAAIHARGWKAWAWTVDSPPLIAQLVQAKIDGIITNRPAQTREAVAAVQKAASGER